VTNADPPRSTIRKRADHANIAAEIDKTVLNAHRRTYSGRAVDRVFLPDAAKVELHTGNLESQPGRTPSDFIQTDPRQQFDNRVMAWMAAG
jgi:hypothetical protein